ncbi:MAG: hypothetical protein IPI43_15905 [Sandaracinaceae bacterium]|nr:hypothetical protein [Sandaracinaceae bacterium]
MADPPRDDKKTRPPGRRRQPSTPAPAVESPARRYVPPAPGGIALRDAAPGQPVDRSRAVTLDESVEFARGDALGQRERGRVTINFSGPPLELPGIPSAPPSPALPASDTARHAPIAPARASASASAPAQDKPEDASDDHDAWVRERKRRSTLPPIAGMAMAPGGTLRPGSAAAPALQHKWVSAHQAPLRADNASPLPMGLPEMDGGALTLVDRSRPSEPALDLMAEVRARYALDDLTGALKMAELLLGADAHNAEAKQFASTCRQRLELLYTSQVGPLDATPRVDVPDTDIRWLGLDHRAGFLLSRVDGFTTLEELLDLSGMPRLEALKTVLSLVDAGAIVIPR